MKEGIHPTYYPDALVICSSCGNTWHTGSTKKEIHVDLCSNCHPFYTGQQRIVDTAGQVERFSKRLAAREQIASAGEAKPSKKVRRQRERDMRSGRTEPEEEATPVVQAAAELTEVAPVNVEAAVDAISPVATAPTAERTAAAPRERKPRPPRKPRAEKPGAAVKAGAGSEEAASSKEADTPVAAIEADTLPAADARSTAEAEAPAETGNGEVSPE